MTYSQSNRTIAFITEQESLATAGRFLEPNLKAGLVWIHYSWLFILRAVSVLIAWHKRRVRRKRSSGEFLEELKTWTFVTNQKNSFSIFKIATFLFVRLSGKKIFWFNDYNGVIFCLVIKNITTCTTCQRFWEVECYLWKTKNFCCCCLVFLRPFDTFQVISGAPSWHIYTFLGKPPRPFTSI